MKMNDQSRRLAALLLMLCLMVCCGLSAFATSANIQLDRTGTITVNLYDSQNDKPLSGGELTLYKVADVKRENGDLSFEYCGDFDGCGIELGDLTDSTLASRLQEYLPQSAEGTAQTIDENGSVTFADLELGLYLVVQTKASAGYKPVNSFLVSLPMAEDGSWNYDVDASPKVGAYNPEEPDTPPTPPDNPDNPVNPEQPDNPDNPVAPEQPDNPDNPVAPENPDQPVLPDQPDKPVLPQTGQLNWPVPVLACSGVLLFAIGWALCNGQRRKEQ